MYEYFKNKKIAKAFGYNYKANGTANRHKKADDRETEIE
jgi:hypothetical protein